MVIKDNLDQVKATLKPGVTLVAVSKTKPNQLIEEAYSAGHLIFGENKALEMRDKAEALPKDIEWHFIGSLQRNKVKYIAPFVALIHSVDSQRLLEEIQKQAAKNDRVIPVLLQVKIAQEESKSGFMETELEELIQELDAKKYPNVVLRGLMGMATNTDDMDQVKREFVGLKNTLDKVQAQFPNQDLSVCSMGMSGDYQLAQEAGSTMVRVGSAIFGQRNYATTP